MSEQKNINTNDTPHRHPVVEALIKIFWAIIIVVFFAGFVIGVDKLIAIVKDFLMG